MKQIINSFFRWYDKHLLLNTAIAAVLFSLQLVHLYWLTTDIVLYKLLDQKFFGLSGVWETIILIVDYTEIPVIITTSLIYLNELRKKFNWKSILFLLFLNSQWLHIFWITDEFVIEHVTSHVGPSILTPTLAWIAIMIDYLELPVIYDTIKKLFDGLKSQDLQKVYLALKED